MYTVGRGADNSFCRVEWCFHSAWGRGVLTAPHGQPLPRSCTYYKPGFDKMQELFAAKTQPHKTPNRSPAERVRFGKGEMPVNHGALALCADATHSQPIPLSKPNRSPAERVRFGKGEMPVNHGALALCADATHSQAFRLVESRGVEPLSESALEGPSPGADGYLHSLAGPRAVTLAGSVASLFMARAKLTARTSTTDRRPDRSRGPLRQDGR